VDILPLDATDMGCKDAYKQLHLDLVSFMHSTLTMTIRILMLSFIAPFEPSLRPSFISSPESLSCIASRLAS
jgi:hypothetical protein